MLYVVYYLVMERSMVLGMFNVILGMKGEEMIAPGNRDKGLSGLTLKMSHGTPGQ